MLNGKGNDLDWSIIITFMSCRARFRVLITRRCRLSNSIDARLLFNPVFPGCGSPRQYRPGVAALSVRFRTPAVLLRPAASSDERGCRAGGPSALSPFSAAALGGLTGTRYHISKRNSFSIARGVPLSAGMASVLAERGQVTAKMRCKSSPSVDFASTPHPEFLGLAGIHRMFPRSRRAGSLDSRVAAAGGCAGRDDAWSVTPSVTGQKSGRPLAFKVSGIDRVTVAP
jgi:hypothetical protein